METLIQTDAISVANLRLLSLSYKATPSEISNWLSTAYQINATLTNLLSAKLNTFWATLVYTENMRKMLDSVADFFTRVCFFNKSMIYLVDEVEELYTSMYESYFYIILRILSCDSNECLSTDLCADLIYSRNIITIQALLQFVSVYSNSNRKLCSAVVVNTFRVQPRFNNDLAQFLITTDEFLERAKSSLSDLVSSLENNSVALNISHVVCLLKLIDTAVIIFLSLASFVRIYSLRNLSQRLFNNLPPFVDYVAKALTDTFLALLVGCSNDPNLLRFVAYKRTLLLQSAMHLFISLYNMNGLSDNSRLLTLYDAIVCKEFLLRFDDEVGMENEFLKFIKQGICTEEHLKTSLKILEEAYAEKSKAIKVALAQKKILRNISQPPSQELEDTLASLSALLPAYSPQQLNLCLKQYNNDVEQTVNALMEKSDIPFELRILMRHRDNFHDVDSLTAIVLPVFTDEFPADFDDGSLEREDFIPLSSSKQAETKLVPAAFSLLPDSLIEQKPVEKPTVGAGKASDRSSKLELIVSKYSDMFDLSDVSHIMESIAKAQKSNEEQIVISDKLLVKTKLERRKLMADKPSLSAEQETAIRSTYNQYKYEMSDDDDEGGRYDLDTRYAASVGKTGRFNNAQSVAPSLKNGVVHSKVNALPPAPVISSFCFDDNEEDEYDDTYDDPDNFVVNDNDNSDLEESMKSKSSTVISSAPRQQDNERKDFIQPRRAAYSDRDSHLNNRNTTSHSSGYVPPFARPSASRAERSDKILLLNEEDDHPPGFPSSSNREIPSRPTTNTASGNEGWRGGRNGAPSTNGGGGRNSAPSTSGGGWRNTAPSTSRGGADNTNGYTGGRARLNKERNKNKMKQRGADRKMRGGMF